MRRVAIIGQGPGSELAPKDGVRWGLPWAKDYTLDLYFEPHDDWRTLGEGCAGRNMYYSGEPVEFLNDFASPIMMAQKEPDVPMSIRYPLDDVIAEVGDYLECSISYALAYAILLRVQEIDLFGVSGDDGYASQRPNIEYLIGYARGVGLKVNVQDTSKLLKSAFDVRYGVE